MSDKIQRKTPRATLKQKIQVLDYLRGPPKRSQLDTLSYFKTQNKFAISQATLSNWAINEYQLRKECKDNPNLEDYKKKPVLKYPDVTLAVEKYIEQAFGDGQTITDKNIKDTFEKFLDKFGYKDLDFKLSAGMLHSFKKRNLITKGRFNIQNDDSKSETDSIKSSENLLVPLPFSSSSSSSAPVVIGSSNNNNNNNNNNLDFNFDDIFNNPSIGFNTRLIHSDDSYSFLLPSMDNNLNDYSQQTTHIPSDEPSLYNPQQNNFNSISSVVQQNLQQLQSIPSINSSIELPKLKTQSLAGKIDQGSVVPPDTELSTTITTTTTTTNNNINNNRFHNFETSPPTKHKLPFYPTYQHPLHHNSNQFKRHNPPFETLINPKLSNPNSEKVEKILENITEGNVTIYNSGTSAIMGILSYINPSSVFIDNLGYQGTHEVIKLLSKLTGLSKYSLSDLHKYDSQQLPPKSVIIIESPMNPLGLIHDLSYYSKIAHSASSCHLIVDSTLAPPPLQFPFKFGADYIVYSAVKYLAGVSDLSAGFIVSRSKDDKIKLHKERFALGTSIANFDSFLLLRSLRTYKMRILTQCGNTEKIIRFLIKNFKKYDNVLSRLHHSSLQPNQDCVKSQLNGYFNPVFALELKDPKYTEKLLRSFNFLSNNPNLEGGETLVELVCNNPNFKLDAGFETKLIRFSVGCEDYEDIIRDIDQALISIVKETV